jgi:hypothetical protein
MKRAAIIGFGLIGLWFYRPDIVLYLAAGVIVGWGFIPQPEWARKYMDALKAKIEQITGIPL